MPRKNSSLSATNGAELLDSGTLFVDGPDAPHPGVTLRVARERLGWALPEVAAHLRIGTTYLQALEDGRLDRTPGLVYALGYVRSYAQLLGLDPLEMARRFRAESEQPRKQADLVFPAPVAERGLPAGALILLGLILAGGAYIGWYRLSGEGRLPAETVANVPARLATLAEQAVPGPGGRPPLSVPLEQKAPVPDDDGGLAEPRQAAAENPLLAPEPPAPLPTATVRQSFPGATPATAIAMPVTPPMRLREEAAAQAPAQPEPDTGRVVLRATADAWVQVRERGGPTLISKVMKAGETFAVPSRPNLILATGNASKVDVLVDGVMAPSLGGAGAVRKDVPLDPEALKAGNIVPASTKR